MAETPRSAYLHIPFCARKCRYCDFPSYAGREDRIESYTDAVCLEIRQAGSLLSDPAGTRPLDTVYFGGGTPTLAGAERLVRMLAALRDTFSLASDAEISLEANPGTVTPRDFELLRAGGFNRLSMGLQAWQPRLLDTLGRIHTARDFTDAVEAARRAGFGNIGADIMLGLPGQSLIDLRETLERVIGTGVDHVSFYSLQIEEGTPFHALYASGQLELPDEDTEREMYHETRRRLAASGRIPYEISSAARPGFECRHNLAYWDAREYFGFGCAAHSYVGGVRRENRRQLDDYLDAVGLRSPDDPFPAARELETVDRDEQMKEVMLLSFRTDAGVDAESYARRFGEHAEKRFGRELAELSGRGLITATDRGWALTDYGRDLANQVFMAFV